MKTTDEGSSSIHSDYTGEALQEADLPESPIALFRQWLNEAELAGNPEPGATTLITTGADGPSGRIVLLRGLDDRGLVFFTNYRSHKGHHLGVDPRAGMVFYWPELHRQVRAEGPAEMVAPEESDEYFGSRPRDSQIGAWASPQSESLRDRNELEGLVVVVEERFSGHQTVPRPEFWGGYRLRPGRMEFWQGRENRLHDRILYEREGGVWRHSRLAP